MDTKEQTTQSPNKWNKSDTAWALSIYGTTIGAGILFLPINAGMGGLLPVIFMALIAFPITFLSHRNVSRFVLSGKTAEDDVTKVITQKFGNKVSTWVNGLYFLSNFPLIMIFSVALTNNVINVMTKLLHFPEPSRWVVGFCINAVLITLVTLGRTAVTYLISLLVLPLLFFLVAFSFAMIPHWDMNVLQTLSLSYVSPAESHDTLLKSLWLAIPVTVFAFYHLVLISAFTCDNRQRYGALADKKTSQILKYAVWLVIVTAIFFVVSCVMSLKPEELLNARNNNLSILDYLAATLHNPALSYASAGIAFVAVITSFMGNCLGTHESLNYFSRALLGEEQDQNTNKKIRLFCTVSIFFFAWVSAALNPSILKTIEFVEGPVFALLLLLFPVYALYKLESLKKYRSTLADLFIVVTGLLCLSVTVRGLF